MIPSKPLANVDTGKKKSIDLHQTARAHLSSSLLKVKSIAASTDLPEEIRAGVSKPELSGEEKAALHNVTSSLYNNKPVKAAVDRAIETVCRHLNLPPPGKSSKNKDKKSSSSALREEQEGQPSDRISKNAEPAGDEGNAEEEEEEEEVTDFEGFQSDVDEPGPAVGRDTGDASSSDDDEDEDDEEEEENQLSKYDHLLGSSSEDEEDFNHSKYDQFRGKETVDLDDISVSGSGSESDDEQSSPKPPASPSLSPSPPPPKAKKQKKDRGVAGSGRPGEVYALPSLMGGYISGSESASDVDVAAPKKRRGQRARQAIAEKKYGSGAKHLQQQQNKRQKGGGRDAGWDMKRGAVGEGEGDQSRRTPWKRGVTNPFLHGKQGLQKGGNSGGSGEFRARETNPDETKPKPGKRDDEGVLHPSWEAKKRKAKESQGATFTGQKIVFD